VSNKNNTGGINLLETDCLQDTDKKIVKRLIEIGEQVINAQPMFTKEDLFLLLSIPPDFVKKVFRCLDKSIKHHSAKHIRQIISGTVSVPPIITESVLQSLQSLLNTMPDKQEWLEIYKTEKESSIIFMQMSLTFLLFFAIFLHAVFTGTGTEEAYMWLNYASYMLSEETISYFDNLERQQEEAGGLW